MIELLSFALDVTGPIPIILALGPLLRKAQLVDDHFVLVGNRLVFNLTLPCMLFFGIAIGGKTFKAFDYDKTFYTRSRLVDDGPHLA